MKISILCTLQWNKALNKKCGIDTFWPFSPSFSSLPVFYRSMDPFPAETTEIGRKEEEEEERCMLLLLLHCQNSGLLLIKVVLVSLYALKSLPHYRISINNLKEYYGRIMKHMSRSFLFLSFFPREMCLHRIIMPTYVYVPTRAIAPLFRKYYPSAYLHNSVLYCTYTTVLYHTHISMFALPNEASYPSPILFL